ncbi:hypothetical protein TNIN_257531 [Trichonephila inaurata madagascariensis]|uniref:Uncharacterized protein n=1 Tax=Trichonephila inaurata madagascariensis TaxID=2747483 RepID=A0A8X6YUI2_9ARAC|nr:hypothetical protein TNIN_257531 [Trichonephila inaurata madagascariensis]
MRNGGIYVISTSIRKLQKLYTPQHLSNQRKLYTPQLLQKKTPLVTHVARWEEEKGIGPPSLSNRLRGGRGEEETLLLDDAPSGRESPPVGRWSVGGV